MGIPHKHSSVHKNKRIVSQDISPTKIKAHTELRHLKIPWWLTDGQGLPVTSVSGSNEQTYENKHSRRDPKQWRQTDVM